MDLIIAQMAITLMGGEMVANRYTLTDLRGMAVIAQLEAEAYCNRTFTEDDRVACAIIARMVANHLTRAGAEGVASQSYSGVSESYIDGLPSDVIAMLNRKRKIKAV